MLAGEKHVWDCSWVLKMMLKLFQWAAGHRSADPGRCILSRWNRADLLRPFKLLEDDFDLEVRSRLNCNVITGMLTDLFFVFLSMSLFLNTPSFLSRMSKTYFLLLISFGIYVVICLIIFFSASAEASACEILFSLLLRHR